MMKYTKQYNLNSVTLEVKKRRLDYSIQFHEVTYYYNNKQIFKKGLDVDRWHKMLKKHYLINDLFLYEFVERCREIKKD